MRVTVDDKMVIYLILLMLPLINGQLLNIPLFPLVSSSQTCPCVKAPNSKDCISYDPQYAAATLEEVIYNFIDTTVADARHALNVLGELPAYNTLSKAILLKCDSKECLGCYEIISKRLINSFGSLTSNVQEPVTRSVQDLIQSAAKLGIGQNDSYASFCETLYNTTLRPLYDSVSQLINTSLLDPIKKLTESKKRQKRQTAQSNTVGTTCSMKCDYKRGDPVDSDCNYVGLCNICWSVRALPDKYFPRYINERNCDQSNNKCLSGYGDCRQVYRNVDLLYNSGTDDAPQWGPVSINSPVSCECQVRSDSAMYDFARS